MSSEVILGSIDWPIAAPFQVLRNEKIPYPFPTSALFENSTEAYCPHLKSDNNCTLKESYKNKGCCYKGNSGKGCRYDDYHKFFLLLNELPNNGGVTHLKPFSEEVTSDSHNTYKKLYSYSDSNTEHVPTILNAFPQPKSNKSKLVGLKIFKAGLTDRVFFEIKEKFIKKNSLLKPDDLNNTFPKNDIVYAKSEYTVLENLKKTNGSGDAFVVLVEKEKIKELLPPNDIEKADGLVDIYLPVGLSFFADKKIDAFLNLAIRTNAKKEMLKTNAKLVRQALGSMREVIYNQRQEFLEKWCMRLGERVDDIVQKSNPENPENHNQAIKKAMEFALEAILKMASSLAVQHSRSNIKSIANAFNYKTDKKDPEQIFDHINKKYIQKRLDGVSPDRKKYVINFCKKAEMYAEEFVSSEGKLKGRLSAPTVRKLKRISLTSNPVNARILIRGEPGGGKGATAEDFHFYCMKRIAKEIKEIGLKQNKKIAKIDEMQDGAEKEIEKKKLETDPYKYLIKHSNYLKEIKKNLQAIFSLPAIYSETSGGSEAVFFMKQISNTGWWLWKKDPDKEDELHKLQYKINKYIKILKNNNEKPQDKLNAEKFFGINEDNEETGSIQKNDHINKLINTYVKLLIDKIKYEGSSKKPDWSFNMLQVNCGILGGENSELSESIARLFGTLGDYKTAMPGLFQTCSYMGGTLFLDEIADCPVRVQDNLLRPLEEGTVSRPGWETFDENVGNIRIIGATFKDLFKLAQQYHETLPSGNPKGFRPDLLTRLTRNTPVAVSPVWHYFVPTKSVDDDFSSQFAFVLNNSWMVSTDFWRKVYFMVSEQIDEHVHKARHHNPDELEGRRKIASKITMRLFKEVGKIARLNSEPEKPDENDPQKNSALVYLRRMLDYLLVETN